MLAIVKTPLQVICAHEYLSKNNINSKEVKFVYLRKYEFNDEQMANTFKFFDIQNVDIFELKNSNVLHFAGLRIVTNRFLLLKVVAKIFADLINIYLIKKFHRLLLSSNHIILGDPNLKIFKKLLPQIKNTNFVLLDDGLGSTVINYNFLQNKNTAISFSFVRPENHQANFVKNDFCALKKLYLGLPSDGSSVIFIGQPLLEAQLLTIAQMRDLFKKINDIYKGKSITYIPHRWETDISKYQFPSNFKVLEKIPLPIELMLLNKNMLPGIITTFYSTAILTLKLSSSANIAFDGINISDDIKTKNQLLEKITEVYALLEKNGIEIKRPNSIL